MSLDMPGSALLLPEVRGVLERLHTLAETNDIEVIRRLAERGVDWDSATTKEQTKMFREAVIPVSREAGRLLYVIARSISAKRIVEFGTSYGVSTIYFAAALRDNGGGLVIGSEFEKSKVTKAKRNLAKAGLSQFAEIREGDAAQTLKGIRGPVDLLLLDGWNRFYLEILHLVSGNLRRGAVVLADDLGIAPDETAPYLDYVRNPANGFVSVTLPLDDGMEYSVKL
jgi:predicted O-methyltransferase YrrM